MQSEIFTVSTINRFIKNVLETQSPLSPCTVYGEISNYKVYPSGHHYFSLKDENAAIRCVMFRSSAVNLRFSPQNGAGVIVRGRISVYERDGQYQLICTSIVPNGSGDLNAAFEALKSKLMQEGLFSDEHKIPIPRYPEKIALITSPVGAAVRDMIRIIGERFPLSKVLVVPVRVQGLEASAEIAAAISTVNKLQLADVIITGRGGGSLEDLWAFNEEIVARAIWNSKIPVISAVGHEPDVTISDYVADLRASTPSNAAELVVPDKKALQSQLFQMQKRCASALEKNLNVLEARLNLYKNSRFLQNPFLLFDEKQITLDRLHKELIRSFLDCIRSKCAQLSSLEASLCAMNPDRVLKRGFSIVKSGDGKVVSSITTLQPEEIVSLIFSDGKAEASVLKIQGE